MFISHGQTDHEFVTRLIRNLREVGLRPWVDYKNIPDDGDDQVRDIAIQTALHDCDMLIVVLSPEVVASHDAQHEWGYCVDHRKPVVVVIAEPCDVPAELQEYARVDYSQAKPFAHLARALGVSMPTLPLNGQSVERATDSLTPLHNLSPDDEEN